jgi:hypothetical protein
VVVFELPDATSPESLGVSGDPRTLGIAMKSIFLSETSETSKTMVYEWGTPVDFSSEGNYLLYQGAGWNDHFQDDFTWTSGNVSTLIIPVHKTSADVELIATFKPFTVPDKLERQVVRVFVNDTFVGEWNAQACSKTWERIMRNRGFQRRTLLIPNSLLTDDCMKITFELPNAKAPNELGFNEDTRSLGIAMRSMVLKESLR